MKIKTYQENLPNYCLSYLINGDESGLNDEDIKNTDDFMQQFYDEASELNGSVVVDVKSDEYSFNPFPAFGLACDTYECNINILY